MNCTPVSGTIRYLIWDFDGTLGYRASGVGAGAWSASLLETIGLALPEHSVTREQIRPHLQAGFPWSQPEHPHLHLSSGDLWWEALYPILEKACHAVGLDETLARTIARQFRSVYLALDRWRLFDDVMPTLDTLSAQGWTHALLSNHVPELGEIVQYLGLASRLAYVFNSAELGYEKPHPQAFKIVLETLPNVGTAWMIGDNFTADVQGAERVGIPAILVRCPHSDAGRYCASLGDVPALLAQKI